MSVFFAFLSRMKYINRWALMRNTNAESLSQHSHEVAAISHVLAAIGVKRYGKNLNPERAALLGLYHDMSEILTGDMPTPVKYFNPEIKSAYKKVEKSARERLFNTLPEDLRSEFNFIVNDDEEDTELLKIVKAADKLSALIKCIEERKAGNGEFIKAEQSTRKALDDLNVKEAFDFIDEFLPSYELTLDQLN